MGFRTAAAAGLIFFLLSACSPRPPQPTPDRVLIYARALQTALAAQAATATGGFIPVTGRELETATAALEAVAPTATSSATSAPMFTPTRTLTPLPSATPSTTHTPVPSATRTRTITPSPSASPTVTRTPTRTVTPAPTPQVFQGSGSGTVNLPRDAVGVLRITHGASTEPFTVTGVGSREQRVSFLVNTTGAYEGRIPLNLLLPNAVTTLHIDGPGPWGVRYDPIPAYDRWLESRSVINGVGDDVWFSRGRSVDSLQISGNAARKRFSVLVLGSDAYELAVNTIDPYSGEYRMPASLGRLYGLVVTAADAWEITIVP